ncbi:hypothetical protein DNHGIG_40400 [Collibacillus ludicampi]|jgi:hypothetical protein|uniref:SLH domain-containing protein n=1 Tax=Collibacillus ludicampi TaxID=2771369 RepID=A0AAV4LKT0_9BACL|nr:S-layer homology domain-containing protein [Collibacillus ludicampi]GIM48491.1 hypothetical protein DNHGIG_40400 [Collibacillus ludicampi]
MKGRKIAATLSSLALIAGLSSPAFADDHGHHRGHFKENDDMKAYSFNFDDVDGNYGWARQAIAKLASQGIISGIDKHHFQPGGTITRAQFATLLSRYFHLQAANGTQQDFQDVSNSDWFFPYVEAAKDYMTAFTDPNGQYYFQPDRPVNRAEAAVTLVRILQNENRVQLVSNDQANTILSSYQDAGSIPVNLRAYVATAIQSGVMIGVSPDRFDPLSNLNRAQVAALFYNIENQLEVPPVSSGTTGLTEVVPGSNITTTTSTITQTGTASGAAIYLNGTKISGTNSLSVSANIPVHLLVEPVDANGNPVVVNTTTTYYLSDNGGNGTFRQDGNTVSYVLIPAGSSGVYIDYINSQSGSYNLTATPISMQLSAPSSVLHGQSYAYTLTVLKNGAVDTDIYGTYTMKVSTTDSTNTSFVTSVTFTNGVAQIPVLLNTTGTQTVTVSNDQLGITGSITVNVQ